MSGARVRFSGDATDLVKAQEEVARGAKKMEDAFESTGREARRLERIASKAFHESATEQEKAERKARDLNKAWKEGYLSTELYERQIRKLNAGLDNTSQKQAKLPSASEKWTSSIIQAAGAYVGISQAIGGINRAYETWINNQRQIAREANKAALDVVAFAALQDDSSVIRERTMKAVQAGAGVASAGESLNLVQSMQSAFGWDKGLSVSENIFKVVQAGVPIDVASEIAAQAAGQGLDPDYMVRAAFSAGQASQRDPGMIGKAAPAMQFFDDKDFGWTVAAQLSGTKGDQVEVYTKQAGLALSENSSLKETFDRLGVGKGATREQRLRALAAAGIDTPLELQEAGLSEIRQVESIANLTAAINAGGYETLSRAFRSNMDNPNLIRDKRAMVEAGLAETELQRKSAETNARIVNSLQFGPKAVESLRQENYDRYLVEELEKRGVPNIGPFGSPIYQIEGGEVGDVDRVGLHILRAANEFNRRMVGMGDTRISDSMTAAMDRLNNTMRQLADQKAVTVTTQEK